MVPSQLALLMAADDLQGCSLVSSGKHVISYFPRISRKFQSKNKSREGNRRSKSNKERQSYHSLQVKKKKKIPENHRGNWENK